MFNEKDLSKVQQTGLVEKSSFLEANIMRIVKEKKKLQRSKLAEELFRITKMEITKEEFTKKLHALAERE